MNTTSPGPRGPGRRPRIAPGAVCVIVGAAGGIGAAVAERLAAIGARLVLADLDSGRLDALTAGLGSGATALTVDATDADDLDRLVEYVERTHGRIDLLVHAGGVVVTTSFAERSDASIAAEIDLDLTSPLVLTRRALPLLRRGRLADGMRAQVIALGSLGGVLPMPDQTVYAAAKAGLRAAMVSLGTALRPEGIGVTCVMPSSVDTPMLWREVAEGGNALQFLGPPQTPGQVADHVVAAIGTRRTEVFPNRVEGLLARAAMLVPGALPWLLPALEPLGRRGMARYRRELESRGDLPDRFPS